MSKLKFILGFHNHQPIGNFDFVIDDAVERAYLPFLRELNKFDIRIALHYTGALLEWLERNRCDVIEEIKRLTADGKIEIMTGAFYEPILAVLPDHDKNGQISKQNNYIEERFNCKPLGFWLAERIWEPHLPKILNENGIKYVVVDDTHFKMAGYTDGELYHYYETEDQGSAVYVFPISQKLRYLIPFAEPQETIAFLRKIYDTTEDAVVTMADDGEKFGIWPGTYDRVYKNKWLPEFFTELLKHRDWLEVTTFDRVLNFNSSDNIYKKDAAGIRPQGNVYLPTSSYTEMTEWALPTKKQALFERYFHSSDVKDEIKQFMRGGFWRNFFHKYTESNIMHKRMLKVSNQVQNAIKKQGLTSQLSEVRDEVWRAQTNCPYWHGVFGGLYLPHLRSAVFEHLINAEKQISQSGYEISDYLLTGEEILNVKTKDLDYFINISRGASVFEIDYKEKNHNILNVLTRRKESYHKLLIEQDSPTTADADKKVRTIHNTIVAKETGLENKLIYDKFPRLSFKEWFLDDEIDKEKFFHSELGALCSYKMSPSDKKIEESSSSISAKFIFMDPISYEKTYTFSKESSYFEVFYENRDTVQKYMSVELNIFLPGRAKELCRIAVKGKDYSIENCSMVPESDLTVIDAIKKYLIDLSSTADSIVFYPIETVSNSESGFESVLQGVSVNMVFDVSKKPENKIRVKIYAF